MSRKPKNSILAAMAVVSMMLSTSTAYGAQAGDLRANVAGAGNAMSSSASIVVDGVSNGGANETTGNAIGDNAVADQPHQVSGNGAVEFVEHTMVQPLPVTQREDSEQSASPADDAKGIAPITAAESLSAMVANTQTAQDLSRQMHCLAGAVYFESRGEPLAGQLAVARVIMNRAKSHQFPSDYCSVVMQRAQFSFVRGGRIPSIAKNSAAWQRAKAIARIADEEKWESAAGDALYFHARYVNPRWARSKSRTARISSHIFYR